MTLPFGEGWGEVFKRVQKKEYLTCTKRIPLV